MMGVMQQRRFFVSLLIASCITYVLVRWHGVGNSATWHLPQTVDDTSIILPPKPLPKTSKETEAPLWARPSHAGKPGAAKVPAKASLKSSPSISPALSLPSLLPPSSPALSPVLLPPSSPPPSTSALPVNQTSSIPAQCVPYEQLQRSRPEPHSTGKRKFPYARPPAECRTFRLPAMEKLLERMKGVIKDPDLFRLFENSYPNTLDTTIKWRGFANKTDPVTNAEVVTDEELAFVITGDIDAMWLRDSASQIYSYLPLLEPSSDPDSLASLWRGVINIHARYIIISPYCHSFQPPPESGLKPTHNGAYSNNRPLPGYDPVKVFDCKWELDSLASFLQISAAYYERTNDLAFFQKYNWVNAVAAAVSAAGAMRLGTYARDGKVEHSAWTFVGWTNRGTETLNNDGLGNPTKENGMVRTAFRPSDDACIFQLLVPANMMWAKYLEDASLIMAKLDGEMAKNLTTEMRNFAFGIRKGIDKDAVVHHSEFGDIFAYEIDGYGGANLMDDANVPSLLAMPLWNYTKSSFPMPPPPQGEKPRNYSEIYSNTRRFVLSDSNPYFMRGPVISAVGGPHIGPGNAWPMAALVRAMTAFSPLSSSSFSSSSSEESTLEKEIEKEVKEQIRMVLESTAGTGVVHESVNSWNEHQWSRAWFGWANGLMGELILKVEKEKETAGGLLAMDWQ